MEIFLEILPVSLIILEFMALKDELELEIAEKNRAIEREQLLRDQLSETKVENAEETGEMSVEMKAALTKVEMLERQLQDVN